MYKRAKEKKRKEGREGLRHRQNATEPERMMMEARVSSREVERVLERFFYSLKKSLLESLFRQRQKENQWILENNNLHQNKRY